MTRIRAVVAAAVVLAVLAGGLPGSPAPADAQAGGGCAQRDRSGKCRVDNRGPYGGTPGDAGGTETATSWICTYQLLDPAVGLARWPDVPVPPEYPFWYFEDCGTTGGNGRFDEWEEFGYFVPHFELLFLGFAFLEFFPAPTSPPSPVEVAQDLWAEVEVELPAPELVVSPPPGRSAIVDQPTFLAVSNWTEIDGRRECDDVVGIVCVTLSARPRLTFDPGDGSDPIACAGSGTVFDPGRDPDAQADAPGACAHRYARRTGAAGRPDAWTATATVTWEISWTSENPDASGTFPDLSLSTTIDRPVDELQGIVVDADGGAR